MLNPRMAALAAVLLLLLGAAGLQATPIVFSGSSGSLSASVSFQIIGNELIIHLTNTSMADVLVPSDVLTAVFFDVQGSPMFTRNYARVAEGSSVYFGDTDMGGFMGGEWAYLGGLLAQGISSVGLGMFGPGNTFPGSNLSGPASPAGLQYGITSAGDDPETGNKPVTGTQPLVKNSVVFSLGGLPKGFSESDISNVSFQYGTDFSESNFTGEIPEPSSLVFCAIGLAALLAGSLKSRLLGR